MWIVVSTYLSRAVTGTYHCLTFGSDVVNVLLVFLVVDKGTQTAEGTFLVLWLVTGFRTFYKDFFYDTCIGVFPVVTQAYARFYLVDILTSGTATSECIPFDFTFVDFYVERFCFGKYGY